MKKKKRYMSIKTFIVLAISIVLTVTLGLCFFGFTYSMKRKQMDDLLASTESRTVRLANDLSFYKMDLSTDDTTISTDIDESAYFNNGRIMVISKNYKILKDTYVLKQNDYIVSKDIMRVMCGYDEKVTRYRGDYAEVIYPIVINDEVSGVIVSTASMQDLNQRYGFLFKRIGIMLTIVFILDILFIILISRKAVERIDEINEDIYNTSHGSLHDKLEEKGFQETRYLAQNYNEVLEKLSTIDQTRQEFVSNVSHELKTPITSMKVLAESLVQNEEATADEYKEFMTDIIAEIDRETKIINDLLTLVRTDNSKSVLNIEEVSVNDMLDSIVKTVMPLAKQRSIDVSYESYKDIVAEVDEVKLSLAISNLVENAVKYNIESGWIKVSLNSDNKYFYVKVADSGVGIPEDAKDKVFDRFYRVDKARSRDTGGTGLGLSITRSIINAHGGTIKVYSESGKGTTFTVRIPLKSKLEKVEVKTLEKSTKAEKTDVLIAEEDTKSPAADEEKDA